LPVTALVNTDGVTLAADGASISDTVDLTQVKSAGEIAMKATHVGGSILLANTTIEHPQGMRSTLSQSDASDVLCGNMTAAGTIQLAGAKIVNHLQMTAVHFSSPGENGTGFPRLPGWRILPAAISTGTRRRRT
jgi:hypothetical protein